MNVTLVSPPPDVTSGVGTYADRLADHVGERVDLERVALPVDGVDPLAFVGAAVEAARTGGDVVHVQFDYVLFGPRALYALLFFPVLVALARRRDLAVVVTVHEPLNRQLVGPPLAGLKGAYADLLNRTLAWSADHLVFLSPQARERFEASAAPRAASCLPHGAPARVPDGAVTDRDAARDVFDYGTDDVVVVAPGYVSRRKGSDVLVALAERCPEYEFLLAGGPPRARHAGFVASLRERAPDNVTVTGHLPEPSFHAAFAVADLVVLPYREVAQTGVVNAVNQSGVFNWCGTHGVPVAAADCAHFEAINERWDCPALFDASDLGVVERCVRDLLDDDDRRSRLGAAVAAYADANDLAAVADEHVALFEEVAG